MTGIRSRTGKRSAFTAVELMVVILIIALLVSLLTAGVVKVMAKIPETQTRVDLGEMDQALASFMADYNLPNPPPSSLLLSENGSLYPSLIASPVPATSLLATQTVQFLQQWLGRSFNTALSYDWNGNGTIDPPYLLLGQQCLVFYLGGIPTYSTLAPVPVVSGMTGFSANVMINVATGNPYGPASPPVASINRKGPYFQFNPARLISFNTSFSTNPTGFFPMYLDAWRTKSGILYGTYGGSPYVYFSSRGKVNGYYPSDGLLIATTTPPYAAHPYYEVTTAGPNYTNNNRYQILSAGQDGIFGFNTVNPTDPLGVPWVPSSGATGNGFDDQANFSSGLLGTGQR